MKKKNRFLDLAGRRKKKNAPRARARAFDDGRPIRLQYDRGFYGAPPMSLAAEHVPYTVEAFEEEEESTEPDTLGGADLESIEQDLEREREREAERERERETSEATRWAPDALAFEQRVRENTEARQKAEAMSQPPEEQTPPASRHDIFNKMGRNMAFAKTFDLGDVPVRRLFDEFDEKLAPQARPEAHSQALSDIEIARDLELMSREAKVTAPATPKGGGGGGGASISVMYTDVPLVPQQTGMSCWAAGAAMLVAWRDRMSVDPSEIARAAGAWAQYQNGLAPEDTSIFPVWGMVPEPAQTYTIPAFANLLQQYGPLWVANAVPGPHIRVVTGINGDGTPDGTIVHINDPWERGMAAFRMPNAGAQYTETYRQFEATQAALARQEMAVNGIYVARLQNPRH
jgi:hypothetical protein